MLDKLVFHADIGMVRYGNSVAIDKNNTADIDCLLLVLGCSSIFSF